MDPSLWIYGLSTVLLLAMVAWLWYGARPLACAVVFAIGRAAIAYGFEATPLTAIATLGIGFLISLGYFLLLRRTEGTIFWWLVLVAGLALLAF